MQITDLSEKNKKYRSEWNKILDFIGLNKSKLDQSYYMANHRLLDSNEDKRIKMFKSTIEYINKLYLFGLYKFSIELSDIYMNDEASIYLDIKIDDTTFDMNKIINMFSIKELEDKKNLTIDEIFIILKNEDEAMTNIKEELDDISTLNKLFKINANEYYYSKYHFLSDRTSIMKYSRFNDNNIVYFDSDSLGNYGLEFICDEFEEYSDIIKGLILDNNEIDDEGMRYLSLGLKYLANLNTLTLAHNKISDNGMVIFSNNIYNVPLLKDLSIADNYTGDRGIEAFGKNLYCVKNINILFMNNNRIGKIGFITLRNNFKYISSMYDLEISNNVVGDEGIMTFVNNIVFIPHLESLYIDNNQISDSSFIPLFNSFYSTITNLIDLNLNHNYLSDKGIICLSDNLKYITNLQRLYISRNRITDIGVMNLCKNLSNITKINTLSLSENNLSDKSIIKLSMSFIFIPKLFGLDLSGVNMEDNGIIEISNNLSFITRLDCLDVSKNMITNVGINRLVKEVHIGCRLDRIMIYDNDIENINSYKSERIIVNRND